MKTKIKFIPIDYDYFDFRGRNYIKLTGRSEQGKKICILDSCPIYFWAILKDKVKEAKIKSLIKEISQIKLDVKGRNTRVEKVELHNKKFLEKPVKALKIFVTNFKDAHDVATELGMEEIEKRRGYDIGLITHYISEKKVKPLIWYEIEGEVLDNSEEFGQIGMHLNVDTCIKAETIKEIKEQKFPPKILAYDIETDELKIGEGEILMISLVSKNFKKVITWKKSKIRPDYVEYVKDEAELLEKFCEYVKEINPDFLTGYFSDGFDLPYLKARASKHKVKLTLGIDGTQPKFSKGNQITGKINGIVHIDLLRFIRTAYSQYMKSETLSLNEVAKEFLGDTKKDFKFKHSSQIEKHEWEKYFEYNLHDSVLTYQLFEKFWPDLLELSKIIQEPTFEISRNGLSKNVESYIIHNLEKFNEIVEKRPTYNDIAERKKRGSNEGAFVLQPQPGLYNNVGFFDFTSMHTSIIVSFNLSKGTLLEKKEKNSYESPEVNIGKETTKYYFSETPGFFPTLVKEIFEKRKQFKQEYKKNPNVITKARSNSFKVLSASVHGYLGFFGARYYSLEAAGSVLAFVRKLNKEAINKVEKEGYKVIYADTDSVAFTLGSKKQKQALDFLKKLNSELPGIMELELEDFYKRGIWVTTRGGEFGAKKKYALIDEKGNLKIRGFETVRRDWCDLARKTQSKVLNYILKNGDEKKALEYTKEIIKKLKSRKIDLKDLIIKTQLKKPISEYRAISPHVVAARKMKELEIPIDPGTLIEYYLAETTGKKSKLVRDKVKLPSEKGQYETKYYLEKQILPAVENIFQVFDINLTELIEGKKQTTLGDF